MRDIGDVVIIGGGAAGCAAAYYLGQAGVKATLIEWEGIGMQASGYSLLGYPRKAGHRVTSMIESLLAFSPPWLRQGLELS